MTREILKKQAKSQLKNRWGLAILTLLVANIIPFITTSYRALSFEFVNITISISLIYLLLNGVIQAGKCHFLINMTKDNETAKFADLFSQFNIYLKTFLLSLLLNLIIFVGCLLFIIPGIIFSYMYSQAFYILVENPDMGVIECLTASRNLMKGEKLNLFVLQLTFIGWYLLSIFTAGIAYIFIAPYYELTLTNYYLSIKNNSPEVL